MACVSCTCLHRVQASDYGEAHTWHLGIALQESYVNLIVHHVKENVGKFKGYIQTLNFADLGRLHCNLSGYTISTGMSCLLSAKVSGTYEVQDSERIAWQDLNHIGCLACLTGVCFSMQFTKQMLQLNQTVQLLCKQHLQPSSSEDKHLIYPFLGSIVYDLLHAGKGPHKGTE